MALDIDKINYMMIEFTSACNARCPACARTQHFVNSGITPHGSRQITMDHMKNLFGIKWPNLRKLNIDGNYGDSMYHPHSLELLEYIADTQDASKIKLYIDSNGGYKKPEFWTKLGDLMKRFHRTSCITFGIDGIDPEMHARYRVRVDLNKVFENAKAFIDNGGNAEWKWIGFDYNDHQLEDAKRMSKEMGFSAFIYKNTRVRHSIIREAMGLLDLDKGVSATSKNVNSTISQEIVTQAKKEIKSVKDFANDSTIHCRFRREKNYGFQVEHSGRIYQCCHLPGYYNYQQPGTEIYKEYEYYTNKYNTNWNSLDEHGIMDILNHQYFQHDLTDSFNNRTDATENPRINRCISKCGSIDA